MWNLRLTSEIFEAAERFLKAMKSRPLFREYVDFYHPDAQGPMDVAEVIWRSDILYAFGDETELLGSFLNLITDIDRKSTRLNSSH